MDTAMTQLRWDAARANIDGMSTVHGPQLDVWATRDPDTPVELTYGHVTIRLTRGAAEDTLAALADALQVTTEAAEVATHSAPDREPR